AVVALSYGVAFAQEGWQTLHPDRHLRAMASPREPLKTMAVGVIGIYMTISASMIIAFGVIPRFRFGASALFWCFILMALSLLSRWALILAIPYASLLVQLTALAWQFCTALPALIVALLIRQPIVRQALQPRADRRTEV
ncbi:MAG TPA: hypothetical protein VIW07_13380, partial [Candidatus Udaeobacter sp.]